MIIYSRDIGPGLGTNIGNGRIPVSFAGKNLAGWQRSEVGRTFNPQKTFVAIFPSYPGYDLGIFRKAFRIFPKYQCD